MRAKVWALVVLSVLMQSCILTGGRPSGSITAAEARGRIANQVAFGWWLACDSYFKYKSETVVTCGNMSTFTDSNGVAYPDDTQLFFLVKALAEETADVRDGRHYIASDVAACASSAFTGTWLWTKETLESAEQTFTVSGFVIRGFPSPGKVSETGYLAGLRAGECRPSETGKVISVGETNL